MQEIPTTALGPGQMHPWARGQQQRGMLGHLARGETSSALGSAVNLQETCRKPAQNGALPVDAPRGVGWEMHQQDGRHGAELAVGKALQGEQSTFSGLP